jgi:uroporphyrinogen decarboxylase
LPSPAEPLLLRAARREPTERTPLWFMRQAGRVLPEYRAVRERWTLEDVVRNPELCVGVSLQPLQRMPLDAAIMFADIMTPLAAIGVPVRIVEGVGPVIDAPVRAASDVARLRALEPQQDVPFVLETLRALRKAVSAEQAVIGFAGAPFTLASYLVEGGPSREFTRTKALMLGAPDVWHDLMARLSALTSTYLGAQARAGADVLQLFDSWVGTLSADDYRAFVQPHVRPIVQSVQDAGVPLIHFGLNTTALLDCLRDDGAPVIGLDWRVRLDEAWERVGFDRGVQGNFDPAALFAPHDVIEARAAGILRQAGNRPGHIFNLGHGVLPTTPLSALQHLAGYVREASAAIRSDTPLAVA